MILQGEWRNFSFISYLTKLLNTVWTSLDLYAAMYFKDRQNPVPILNRKQSSSFNSEPVLRINL